MKAFPAAPFAASLTAPRAQPVTPRLAGAMVAALCLVWAGPALGQGGAQGQARAAPANAALRAGLDVSAERARVQAERNRLVSQREREEADCRQRFAVTGCIERAREQVRVPLADLDRQERVLDDLERRDRSATKRDDLERRQGDTERRQADQRARAAADQAAREERAAAKAGGPKPSGKPRAPASTSAAPASAPAPPAAIARAPGPGPAAMAQPSAPVASPRAAAGPSAEEARANAQAHADRVRQAEEHRASVQRRMANRAKPPASDLPPPPR